MSVQPRARARPHTPQHQEGARGGGATGPVRKPKARGQRHTVSQSQDAQLARRSQTAHPQRLERRILESQLLVLLKLLVRQVQFFELWVALQPAHARDAVVIQYPEWVSGGNDLMIMSMWRHCERGLTKR